MEGNVVIIDGCGWRLEELEIGRLKCMRDQFSA